jgi:hypothetical protein
MARMKKVESGNRSSAAKGKSPPKNVDEYLAGVPEPARTTLNKIRAAIRSAVPPEATEVISYGIPAFKYRDRWCGSPRFRTIAVCSLLRP